MMSHEKMAVQSPNERRQVLRFPVQLQIDLILSDGTVLSALASNLSQQGLQFRCDSWLADAIEPRGIQNHPLDQIQLKTVAILPISGENKMYARCRIVAARRLSQEEYMLGLEFIDFEKRSDKALYRYIDTVSKESS